MDALLQDLPDDPETLKAMIADMRLSRAALEAEVAAMKATQADAQARIERLHMLRRLGCSAPVRCRALLFLP